MLRLSKFLLAATAAAALFASSAALAQGLGTRITDAGTKLDQDSQACRSIDLGEYARLLQEAGQNKIRAQKAAKKNVPVDQAQVDADLANASALFNRAMAALVQQCMRQAQGQTQPPSTSLKPPFKLGPGVQQYLEAKRECDLGAMAIAISHPSFSGWEYEYLTQAKLLNFPDDVKQCVNPDSAGTTAGQSIDPDKATIPLPEPAVAGSAMNFDSFNQQMLGAHNQLRGKFGAPPLKLDELLVAHATERAQEMARAGDFTHASRAGRGTERENIAKVPAGYGPLQVFERWAREQSQFKPGIFPDVCTTGGDCSGVLHLTAILWPDTVGMGCGSAAAAGYTYVVCRMNPGGNKDGKPVGLPVQIAENETIRPRLIGGDYGQASADPVPKPSRNSAWYVGGDFGSMIVEDVDFDFGLEPTIPSSAIAQIALNHDYGYDAALFVGYDLGAFRIEAETAYKKADMDSFAPTIDLPGEGGIDTKVEQPALSPVEVFKNPMPATAGGKVDPDMAIRTAPLFDLGIYAGGAWTSDWFSIGESPIDGLNASPAPTALSFMVNGMLDFGDDEGISGFVGGGVGVARVDYNNIGAFSHQAAIVDDSDTEFARKIMECLSATGASPDAAAPTAPSATGEVIKPTIDLVPDIAPPPSSDYEQCVM